MKNGPYNLVIAPKKYPGMKYRGRYAYEHHVEWWKKTKKIPGKGWEIHHVDGNHRNNKINNLLLVTASYHKKIHADLRRKPPIILSCPECFSFFEKRPSEIANNKRRKSKNYCSRHCSGRANQRISRR